MLTLCLYLFFSCFFFFFFSSRRRHTRWNCDWSSDVCSSDLNGVRGVVEIRDNGTPIDLDDRSAEIWQIPLQALTDRSLLVVPLAATTTLTEAETLIRDVCGHSEIDYERAKAIARNTAPSSPQ